jgi:hypothetical protein
MSAPLPFLPPVLALVDEMLSTKKIPALSGDEMEALAVISLPCATATNGLRLLKSHTLTTTTRRH